MKSPAAARVSQIQGTRQNMDRCYSEEMSINVPFATVRNYG